MWHCVPPLVPLHANYIKEVHLWIIYTKLWVPIKNCAFLRDFIPWIFHSSDISFLGYLFHSSDIWFIGYFIHWIFHSSDILFLEDFISWIFYSSGILFLGNFIPRIFYFIPRIFYSLDILFPRDFIQPKIQGKYYENLKHMTTSFARIVNCFGEIQLTIFEKCCCGILIIIVTIFYHHHHHRRPHCLLLWRQLVPYGHLWTGSRSSIYPIHVCESMM